MPPEIKIPDEELYKYSFYRAGTKIVHQGDKSTDIFILKKGAVTVSVDGQIMMLINNPNTMFGEMSFFLGVSRTATIEAVEDSEVVVIPGEKLYRLVFEKPDIGIELLKILSDRLKNTTKYATRLEKEIIEYRDELRRLKDLKEETITAFEDELLTYGYITAEQLAEARKEYSERQDRGEDVTFSKILIDKKYLTYQQLLQYLEFKQFK
jgi:CRP-like cAMP-binding protein